MTDLSRYADWTAWLTAQAARDPDLRCLWVGGSAATGGYDEWSDLDVDVLASPGAAGRVYDRLLAGARRDFGIRDVWELPPADWPDGPHCFLNGRCQGRSAPRGEFARLLDLLTRELAGTAQDSHPASQLSGPGRRDTRACAGNGSTPDCRRLIDSKQRSPATAATAFAEAGRVAARRAAGRPPAMGAAAAGGSRLALGLQPVFARAASLSRSGRDCLRGGAVARADARADGLVGSGGRGPGVAAPPAGETLRKRPATRAVAWSWDEGQVARPQ